MLHIAKDHNVNNNIMTMRIASTATITTAKTNSGYHLRSLNLLSYSPIVVITVDTKKNDDQKSHLECFSAGIVVEAIFPS